MLCMFNRKFSLWYYFDWTCLWSIYLCHTFNITDSYKITSLIIMWNRFMYFYYTWIWISNVCNMIWKWLYSISIKHFESLTKIWKFKTDESKSTCPNYTFIILLIFRCILTQVFTYCYCKIQGLNITNYC